ncbi:MAG: ABC transporter permease [Dehalococcoidia bacterium]|nr:ABC transporter permease [Dehalococcoidia bacterium]
MAKFILRRLLYSIPTVFGITIASFSLVHMAPGDPVQLLVFGAGGLDPDEIARLRSQLGLDQPILIQYLNWLSKLMRFDLGTSFFANQPVSLMVFQRMGNTLQLTIVSLTLSLLVGIPLGIVAALNAGSVWDHVSRLIAVLGSAIPQFWLGILCILVFSLWLRVLPAGSMYTLSTGGTDVIDRLKHLILPAVVLSTTSIAIFSRFIRAETLEVLHQDYIRTANAKGLSTKVVVTRHVAKNALIPIITLLGGSLERLFGGAVVIETIFSWPGMGRMGFDAAMQRDYPVLMGLIVISSILVVVGYLIADIAYAWVDPRIKHS